MTTGQLDNASKSFDSVKERVAILVKKWEIAREELEVCSRRISHLELQIKEKDGTYALLKDIYAEFRKNKEAEHSELWGRMRENERKFFDVIASKEALQKEILIQKESNRAVEDQFKQVVEELALYKGRVKEREQKIHAQETSNRAIEGQLNQVLEQLALYKEQVKECERRDLNAIAERDRLEAEALVKSELSRELEASLKKAQQKAKKYRQDVLKLRSVRSTKDENIKELKDQIKELKLKLRAERNRNNELKESLKFYVGDAFARTLGSGKSRYIKLPIAVLATIAGALKYLGSKRKHALVTIPQHSIENRQLPAELVQNGAALEVGVSSNKTSDLKGDGTQSSLSHWPKPLRSQLAWQAMKLMEDRGVDEAISFYEKYADESTASVCNIFHANKNISNDAAWLTNINQYLQQYKILPISLLSADLIGQKSQFQRITCKVPGKFRDTTGPKISVIMPAYNAEDTIEHSVNSILNQTWHNLELIVVDDCSSDRTWEVLESISKKDKRLKIIKNKANVGPYVSKNIALMKVDGEYLTGHDADDWAHPQRLERQVRALMEDKDIHVCIGRMLRVDENRLVNFFTKIGKMSHDGVSRLAYISCMFRTSEFKKYLGHWDSVRFGGDSELIERAKTIWSSGFYIQDNITMICLDAAGSLTNDPEHGVCRVNGVSKTRATYRDAWMEWHKTLDSDSSRMPFPVAGRSYLVPDALEVPRESILKNLASVT